MATYKSNDLLKGEGETGSSFVINVTRLRALRIPMLYAFGKYTDFGPTGIWIAMILSKVVIYIIGQIWFEILFRRNTISTKQIT